MSGWSVLKYFNSKFILSAIFSSFWNSLRAAGPFEVKACWQKHDTKLELQSWEEIITFNLLQKYNLQTIFSEKYKLFFPEKDMTYQSCFQFSSLDGFIYVCDKILTMIMVAGG